MVDPGNSELARQLAVLEERMKTHKAESESAMDRLRTDLANWKAEMASREIRLIMAMLVVVGLAVAILKFD